MVPRLEVFDSSTGEDVLVGEARFMLRRGSLSTTFFYAHDYLAAEHAYAIDPALPLVAGPLHVAGIPGAFRDSSPDRWGRHLIERAQRFAGRSSAVPLRRLDDVDFLIGVFDQAREGSLRFRSEEGEFLAAAAPVPPILHLPKLMDAARKACEEDAGHAQLKDLLDAGSGSLGGARPKASIVDEGKLLLAKFSHPNDEWDVMAWEKVVLDLAEAAGIPVPRSKLVRVGGESTLLLERFDREGSQLEGRRIPYISAMTVLRSSDGESRDYAELAEAVALLVDDANAQLNDLFRRVAFFVAVGNTDDHLRNWGFLRRQGSWVLSPLFDANPNPYEGAQRATGIAGRFDRGGIESLTDLAVYAGLAAREAEEIISEVLAAVSHWRVHAQKNGCAAKEMNLFAPIFDAGTKMR